MQKTNLPGRLVRTRGNPSEVYVVTGTAFDVGSGKEVAHVRRIRPLPPAYAEPIPISDLVDAESPAFWAEREGLTRILSRALHGMLDNPGAVLFSKAEFKEYQFRPLLKFEESAEKRLLVADEVGLGKTIEAAYILVEEIAKGSASRALVLCPSGLKAKWQAELWRRFGLNFQIANGRRLRTALHSRSSFRIIASFDLDYSPEWLDSLATPVDFLIIDEVHNMIGRTGDTMRRRLGFEVSRSSRQVVGLSATPIQLNEDDLRRVLEVILGRNLPRKQFQREIAISKEWNSFAAILRGGGLAKDRSRLEKTLSELERLKVARPRLAEIRGLVNTIRHGSAADVDSWADALKRMESLAPLSLLITRTRKSEVGQSRERRISNHPVSLGTEAIVGFQRGRETAVSESGLFVEVDGLLERYFAHVHRQQLSSCLPAMLDLMRTGMRGFRVWRRDSQLFGQSDVPDVELEDGAMAEFNLPKGAIEECAEIADRYGLLEKDSKWEELRLILEVLAQDPAGRKAIVFTQWVPTLRYLGQKAKGVRGIRVMAVSGDDSEWKVERSLAEFRSYVGPAVLFTTDMLSEGIDLQVADTLVNYDFPYNPQRVEQRIGRIDRVGQESLSVNIHNIWVRGSLDEQIMDILQDRLDIFRRALGDATDLFVIRPTKNGQVELVWQDKRHGSTMARLGELELFSGLVDFLDPEARGLRRLYGAGLRALSWVLVARAIVLSTGGRASVEEGDESLMVGPVADDDLLVLASWAGVREAGLVKSTFEAFRDEQQRIRLSKGPNGDGLYVPPSHPVARLAVQANSNSFEQGGFGRGTLKVTASTPPLPGATQLAICRYSLTLQASTVHDLICWESIEGGWRRLTTERQIRFREWLVESPIRVESVAESVLPEDARSRIQEDAEAWAKTRMVAMWRAPGLELERSQSTIGNSEASFECIAVIYSGEKRAI